MANKLFKTSPPDVTLEDVRDLLSRVAEKLSSERMQLGIDMRFARVYVGSVLRDPRDGSTSFLVSYSDHDAEAPERIDRAYLELAAEQVNQNFFLRRGLA